MKKITNQQIVLGELQRAYDKTIEANDFLDDKLQNVLDYSSMIFAIVSTITVATILDKVGVFFWLGLFISLILYMVTYFKIKKGQTPIPFCHPISKDESELNKRFINVEEEAMLDLMISAHIFSLYEVGEINIKKDEVFRIASNLMFCIVIMLFLTILFGLIFPTLTFSDLTTPLIELFKVKP